MFVIAVENGHVRDAVERALHTLGIVAQDDYQRVDACLPHMTDYTADQRFTVQLHEELVLPHACRHARCEDDAGYRSRTLRHVSPQSFRASGRAAAVRVR